MLSSRELDSIEELPPRSPRARPARLFPARDWRHVILPRPQRRKDWLAPARTANIRPRLPSPSETVDASTPLPPPPPWHPPLISPSSHLCSLSFFLPPKRTRPSSPTGQGNATVGKEPGSQ